MRANDREIRPSPDALRPRLVWDVVRIDRCAGDLQCQRLHCREKIDPVLARGPEFSDGGFGGAGDVPRQERHRARRKGWRDGAALVFPILALAEQETAAEQRAQYPYSGGSTTIIAGVLDKDMVDPLGSIENDLGSPEKASEDDVILKGLRRERRPCGSVSSKY